MPQQRTYTLSDFDFHLPPDRIAQHPAPERTGSRLLDGTGSAPIDRQFTDLPQLLRAGDLLIFNDTQVIKARLFGNKPSGGQLELLVERVLHEPDTPNTVAAHMKVSKKPATGTVLHMQGGFTATLLGRWPDANGPLFRLQFHNTTSNGNADTNPADPYTLMAQHGHVPLPPYITHASSAQDERRYQTVFATHPGAVAAPTAALHFDQAMLATLEAAGVHLARVTLHVGAGTFQPVKTENLSQHTMHGERYHVPPETIAAIQACRARGGRIVAVGTTSVRALESWANTDQTSGDTHIFITPGYCFSVVDMLLTNFHLPKSTLMMLVSAFATHPHIMALYQHAIAHNYRFFSYGDAMLLQRA